MLLRPLIPILFSFVGGILIGHMGFPPHQSLIFLLFVLITLTLIASLFIPFRLRFPCFTLIFFLAGILFALNSHHASDLTSLVDKRENVIIEGTVLQPATIVKGMTRFEVRTHRLFIHGRVKTVREKLRVSVYNHGRDFSPGEKIRFPARLRPFKNFNNPGRYDYELAMKLMGLSGAASVSDGRRIVPMGRGELGFPMDILERARRPIRDLFKQRLSSHNQSLYRALILGERQGITTELREPFNISGLGHVLAVSGLHIGLVAWLAFFLSKGLLSLSYNLALKTDIRKVAALITCLPVVVYPCLAGLQVSSQRAMIMALTYLFSIILGRERDVWSTLCLAALLILAVDPHALYSISFQLSFCAVVGILWLTPAIYKMIPDPFNETGQKTILKSFYVYFTGLIIITTSALIFLLPITSFYFHRVPLVSIPANLTVVPILGLWIIPLGLLSAICLPFSDTIANLFLHLGAWGLEWMMALIRFWAHFNWAAFWIFTPNIFEIILFYCLILLLFFIRRWRWAKIGLALVLFLIASDISYWIYTTRFSNDLRVTYFDVGHGNSALIQFPGKERMLIDGGGFPSDTFDVGGMVVAPSLFHSKIRRIDYLVLTHPQADHMNGLRFIAAHFQPKEFWYNGDLVENRPFRELMNILDSKKIKRFLPSDLSRGREISGVKIELLHPLYDMNRRQSYQKPQGLNDRSLVLKFSYEGKSILFPGDLEMLGEEMVVSNVGHLLKSDILLAPHHGSKTSCSKPFLQMVRPRICIISSGSGSYFGFPHMETMQRLNEIGCRIVRIDQVGAVQLSIGPNKFEMKSFLDGDY
ncbi:MAG: DNA internalization-related competence protein ComEC/Rec2 [Desulfobacteraceae bacterium]|nr:DNA internalization-related competence protein ComEC/Rec2 [Desulfobacteraceae bacterium]